ncbi:MAG: hypothetical protein PVF22_01200 [Candidatus Aminicenantes bacterium]|jgi:hypothetical protein
MKKSSLIILVCLFVLSSCVTNDYWKLKIEVPRKTQLDLNAFDEVIITPFLVKGETEDIDLNKEIVEYFVAELKRKTQNPISTRDVAVDKEDSFESKDFWQNIGSVSEGTLFLTGSAEYSEETRKALIKRSKKRYEDPFPTPAKLEQRKFFTLNLDLYLIDAQTGEAVFKREFKETKAYSNPNQTAYFAFFDLILQVKEKLLRSILGTEQVQERYLIIK